VNANQTSLPIRVFRSARLGLHILQGLLIAALGFPFANRDRRERLIQRWSVQLLEVLNVSVALDGQIPDSKTQRIMFVANHITWLDIWAINSVRPMRFIAKQEIRTWPLVGWLTQKGGTLFIERKRRQDTGRITRAATQALRDGDCLCIFPEGTTTDGTEVRQFKTSLLQPSIDAGAMLWPLSIRYPLPGGEINTAIAYWADVTMMQSLKEVLKQRQIKVKLRFGTPLSTTGQDRRTLAQQSREVIVALLSLPPRKGPETHGDLRDVAH
jgi:1-acyl-sn-glycerol-3-phosphate acyltransferase